MNGLSFGHPWLVGVTIVVVSLSWWALGRERQWRRKALAAFGEESVFAAASTLPATRARLLRDVLQVGAVALGLIALARPQLGEQPASAAHRGRDVLVLLDLSRSMNAADDSRSRLVAAKNAIARVLAAVPEDRVGLIVFGGSAFLQLPLTGNHPAFQRFLDAASSDDLGDPGTDLSSALSAAATVFEHDGERGYQSILVASDGESGAGDLAPPMARLSKAGIPVFAIGIGSPQGAPIPADSAAAPDKWHRDHIGRVVISRLEEGELRRAAGATGGLFVRATPNDLQRLAAALTKMQTRTLGSRESTERIDRYQWPLALALLALAAAPAVAVSRIAPVLLMVLAGCSTATREARRGQQQYAEGHYHESYQAFQRALSAGADPSVQFSLGTSLYRMRRYEEAVKSFREATSIPNLRQAAYYNLGNAYVRASEEAAAPEGLLRQAISAYEEALRLEPADSAAKWNLELAVRRRGEDRESGGSSGRGRSADYGRGNMDVPGYEGNQEAAVGAMAGGGYGAGEGESAEELSESQARQLLEAVEREQLSSHQGRPSLSGAADQKDW